MGRGTWIIGGVTLAIALLLAIGRWAGFSLLPGTDISTTHVTAPELADCERFMQVKFPAGAEPLGFWLQSWQDTVAGLKVRMSRVDLSTFLASSPIAGLALSTTERHISGTREERWWHPDSIKNFKSAEATMSSATGGDEFLSILIGYDDPNHVVIYLVWMDP